MSQNKVDTVKTAKSLVANHDIVALAAEGGFDLVAGFAPIKGHLYTVTRAISARINQNYDGFPAEELRKAYKTFLGKPVFVNHVNEDPSKARGRVVGARYVENGDDKFIEVIQEVNAAKFPKVAKELVEGGLDSVSMGCSAERTICSFCGNVAVGMFDMCAHVLNAKGRKLRRSANGATQDVLVYEECRDLGFFELSYVFDPADETAVVSTVLTAARQANMNGTTDRVWCDLPGCRRWTTHGGESYSNEWVQGNGTMRTFDYCCEGHRDQYEDKYPSWAFEAGVRNRHKANMQHRAFGEIEAPAPVDTLREEGEGETDDFHRYVESPAELGDPDISKAKELDRREDLPEGFEDYQEPEDELAPVGDDMGAPGLAPEDDPSTPIDESLELGDGVQPVDEAPLDPAQVEQPPAVPTQAPVPPPPGRPVAPNPEEPDAEVPAPEPDTAPPTVDDTPPNEFDPAVPGPEDEVPEGETEDGFMDMEPVGPEVDDMDDEDKDALPAQPSAPVPPPADDVDQFDPTAPGPEDSEIAEDSDELVEPEPEDAPSEEAPPFAVTDEEGNPEGEPVDTEPAEDSSLVAPEELDEVVRAIEKAFGISLSGPEDEEPSDADADQGDNVDDEDERSRKPKAAKSKGTGDTLTSNRTSTQRKNQSSTSRRDSEMGNTSLAQRGRVATRGRVADQSRNDQGEQEEVFQTQTPPEEGVVAPTGDESKINNTEENLVARIKADREALIKLRASKSRKGGKTRQAEEKTPTEVNPEQSGTDEDLKGDFTSADPNDGVEETQPKDAAVHQRRAQRRYRHFAAWVRENRGKSIRQAANAGELRSWAKSYATANKTSLKSMYPLLKADLTAIRTAAEEGTSGDKASKDNLPEEFKDKMGASDDDSGDKPEWLDDKINGEGSDKESRRKASTRRRATRKVADDKLDVAAPDGRVDVEAPTSGTTDDEAQASQFDKGDFGDNAGDDLADPDLSTDQNWAPGEGKKNSSVKKASGVAAVRLAEAYVAAGLSTQDERWKLANSFEQMSAAIVADRTALLDRVVKAAPQRQAAKTAGNRGTSTRPRAIPQGITRASAPQPQTREASAEIGNPDSDIFY